MSLPGIQAVLPPPSQPANLTYAEAANIDALNSYPNGYSIDLTTTQIGAFLATVPTLIRINAGSSTQAVWIKNTSGNRSSNSIVVCVGGMIDGEPAFVLNANAQFTVFTGDGSGNLTTS
jgi:hypothetical protein